MNNFEQLVEDLVLYLYRKTVHPRLDQTRLKVSLKEQLSKLSDEERDYVQQEVKKHYYSIFKKAKK